MLPYDKFAHAVLEITNPTPYDTELYSLEFDKEYLVEEETLNQYEEFDKQDVQYVQVRQPGEKLWDFVKKSVEKRKAREEIQVKLNRHA